MVSSFYSRFVEAHVDSPTQPFTSHPYHLDSEHRSSRLQPRRDSQYIEVTYFLMPTSSQFCALRRYANRAKNIKNNARVNEDPKDAMIRNLENEIELLRKQVEEGTCSMDSR